MTDDNGDDTAPQVAQATVKRGPGRPRKVSYIDRDPMREATQKPLNMRAKPNWEFIDPNAVDTPDRLRIDADLIPEGMSLQWITDSVFGQGMPQHRSKFEKGGWTPVHHDDFDGQFNGKFAPRGSAGEINVEGLVLVARPIEITQAAAKREKVKAMDQVRLKEQGLLSGDVNTGFDPTHPSAIRSNKISKTMERIEVPED